MIGESWNVFRIPSASCSNNQTFAASYVKIQGVRTHLPMPMPIRSCPFQVFQLFFDLILAT